MAVRNKRNPPVIAEVDRPVYEVSTGVYATVSKHISPAEQAEVKNSLRALRTADTILSFGYLIIGGLLALGAILAIGAILVALVHVSG